MEEWCLLALILLLFIVVAVVVALAFWRENQQTCVTPAQPPPPTQLVATPVPTNGNNEVTIISTSNGRAGITTHPQADYSFHAPSLVGGLPGTVFLGCSEASRRIGGSGNTVAFASDVSNSMTVWRLQIAPNGCWQAPFHSHIVEETWVVTNGTWHFRWYSPGSGATSIDGKTITFDANGRPSGPNREASLSKGDVMVIKRNTFFEWGSDVGGSEVVVTFPGAVMDGAINEISGIVADYNAGKIPQDQVSGIINTFGERYHTPFVRH